ncbi:MAG: Rpn family recombination-promoting nuclease/putative transposase, partial [Verrucomicrobiota bacterium]
MEEDLNCENNSQAIQNPHDRFVRGYFSDPATAKGLLEVNLPSALAKALDLDQITVENSHFVDEQLREFESDLLFRIPRKDRAEVSDAYVYILWEHQRQRDSWMVLRMWIYLAMIYKSFIDDGRIDSGARLPFVYPVVLYQGKRGWEKGLKLSELIDGDTLDASLQRWLPKFEIDLIALKDDDPRVQPEELNAKIAVELLRAEIFEELEQWLRNWIGELNAIHGREPERAKILISYAFAVPQGLTKERFMAIVKEKGGTEMEFEAGSLAAQFFEEGEARGEARGAAQGENKRNQEIVARLLVKGKALEEIADILDLPLN